MDNKPSPESKKKRNYAPYVIVAAIMYFAISIPWLAQYVGLAAAILVSLVVFIFMTGVVYFVAPLLRRIEVAPDSNPTKRLLFGKSSSQGVADETEDGADKQKGFRREAWIEGLRREARKVHDRIFRMGAVISLALILYAVIMKAAFDLTPSEVFMVAWPVVAVIWFIQIVFFPKWMTYASFVIFCGLRIGMQAIGPQVLMYLPQFFMLPVFYLLMMFFMYGSIMLPNLWQIKFYKPGEGNWEVPKGSTRGQFAARGVMETQIDRFVRYSKGLSDRPPTRGIIETGSPGTGKTLFAKETASALELPFVFADASAFNAPFMGFAPLLVGYVRGKTEGMAREYGGAVFFIDEGEILFGSRSGMQQQPNQYTREVDLWDVLDTNGCQAFDVPQIRTRQWDESQMAATAKQAPPTEGKHGVFMMPGAMGGGSAAIFPFLTWMSGVESVPFMQRFLRSKANTILNALFMPVTFRGKVLRLPPGKPQKSNVLFITATNRVWMFDPAMERPGRFGIRAEFVLPDEDERADIGGYYLRKWHKMGYYQDDLIRPERIREFAQTTPNASPAELEQMVEEAVDVRVQHIAELRRLKRFADDGQLETLLERDQKFWLRFKNTVYDANGAEIEGWDDERVDWQALMETRSSISFGRANPEATNAVMRRKVAFHEFGHFIALKTFNGRRIKPTLLTVVPRRGNLGMVAHIPHDTREQHHQEFYEGLVRTSVASWATEHFFYGQNLPGVSGDLKNATNVACLMIGKFGMSGFDCSEEDQKYYREIGEVLISEPETSMFNPLAGALLDSVLRNPANRAKVAVILGMAAIDTYRLVRANQALFLEVIPEFLTLDEFSGNRLTDLWQKLDEKLVGLDQMDEADQQARPEKAFAVTNPFYGKVEAEGASTYQQVVTATEGAR